MGRAKSVDKIFFKKKKICISENEVREIRGPTFFFGLA